MEIEYIPLEELQRLERILLQNMRQHAPELRQVLEDAGSESCYDDGIYRYYSGSFKVFHLQGITKSNWVVGYFESRGSTRQRSSCLASDETGVSYRLR